MVVFLPIVKETAYPVVNSLFKWHAGMYTVPMHAVSGPNGYMLPPLSDEFLYQIIFCMEDQANEYCVDLKDGVITESAFVADRREMDPQRFLELPPWYPSDGFRTMEKFVSTLRNPIYRERLKQVLQSGKGVFRQFKDVLHEQPSLERLWYYYKDKEIRRRIFHWYERHDEAFRLARLGEEAPADRPDELLREDFTLTDDAGPYMDEIRNAGEAISQRLMESGIRTDRHLAVQIREAWKEHEDDRHLIALTLSGQFVAFIRYRVYAKEGVSVIRCYMVKEEFQGLGVFHYLFDALCVSLNTQGIREIIVRLAGESIKVEPMFEMTNPLNLTRTIAVSIPRWCDEILKIDQSAFA